MRKILAIFEVFLGVFEKSKEKKDRDIAPFPGGEKSAESCHISGCRGFLVPTLGCLGKSSKEGGGGGLLHSLVSRGRCGRKIARLRRLAAVVAASFLRF